MKLFLITLSQKQPHALSDPLLTEHAAILERLSRQGRLVAAGPFVNNRESFYLVRAETEDELNLLTIDNPFIKAGYYQQFEINETLEASATNRWLTDSLQILGNLGSTLSLQKINKSDA